MEIILNAIFAFILIAYSFEEELILVATGYIDRDKDAPTMKITKCIIPSLVSTVIFFTLYVFMLGNPITNILVWNTIGLFVFNTLLNYTYYYTNEGSNLEFYFFVFTKFSSVSSASVCLFFFNISTKSAPAYFCPSILLL